MSKWPTLPCPTVSHNDPLLSPIRRMLPDPANEEYAELSQGKRPPFPSEVKTVVEGLGFFLLGFIGLLASYYFTGRVKAIIGIAILFGAGLMGRGLFRYFLGDRHPTLVWVATVMAAIAGLVISLGGLFLILGENAL